MQDYNSTRLALASGAHASYSGGMYGRNTSRLRMAIGRITPAVKALIAVTAALYFLQYVLDLLTGGLFTRMFALSLRGMRYGFIWQLVTYIFLHGSLVHLLFNMMVLFFIGPETERGTGARHFLIVYFLSGILGGAGWLLMNPYDAGLCVGASGSVLGVLAAFAVLYPNRRLILLFFPFYPIKAWVVMLMVLGLDFMLMTMRPETQVAYAVHVVGVIAGGVYTLAVFQRSAFRRFFGDGRTGWRGRGGAEPGGLSAEELDRILDKISRGGMGSLTREERRQLEAAGRERRRWR